MRRAKAPRRWRGVAAAVALGCALAACSAAGDPDGDGASAPTAATSPSPAPTDSTAGSTAPPTVPAAPTPAATEGSPQPTGELAEQLAGGGVLVASNRGVDLVGAGDGGALTSIPAARAYADGAGGVVFQGLAPPQDEAPSAAIMWLPPDGGDAVTVVPDGAADAVTLHDAAVIDGLPTAIYTQRSGRTPDAAEQHLMLLPLPDGEPRALGTVGGFESGAASVSYGGDLVAELHAAGASTWFVFRTPSGEQVTVPANPLPQDEPCGGDACPTAMTISDDGSRLAWAGGQTVNVAALDDGERRTFQLPDPAPDTYISDLHFVGGQVLVNRALVPEASDPEVSPPAPLRIDLSAPDGDVADVDVPGFATLVSD